MNHRYALVIAVSLGIFLPASVFAASKKKPTAPPVVQPPTIAAVTADSMTVKDAQTTKTLVITSFTEINVNGRKTTAADLKPGMTVN